MWLALQSPSTFTQIQQSNEATSVKNVPLLNYESFNLPLTEDSPARFLYRPRMAQPLRLVFLSYSNNNGFYQLGRVKLNEEIRIVISLNQSILFQYEFYTEWGVQLDVQTDKLYTVDLIGKGCKKMIWVRMQKQIGDLTQKLKSMDLSSAVKHVQNALEIKKRNSALLHGSEMALLKISSRYLFLEGVESLGVIVGMGLQMLLLHRLFKKQSVV